MESVVLNKQTSPATQQQKKNEQTIGKNEKKRNETEINCSKGKRKLKVSGYTPVVGNAFKWFLKFFSSFAAADAAIRE